MRSRLTPYYHANHLLFLVCEVSRKRFADPCSHATLSVAQSTSLGKKYSEPYAFLRSPGWYASIKISAKGDTTEVPHCSWVERLSLVYGITPPSFVSRCSDIPEQIQELNRHHCFCPVGQTKKSLSRLVSYDSQDRCMRGF